MFEDAARHTRALVLDLDGPQLSFPRLAIINPPLWEVGHVAWFQERWLLRHLAGRAALREDADLLWDSAAVAHETRWDLPLPRMDQTLACKREVLERVLERLASVELDERGVWLYRLAISHEDMHDEALITTRQTLGLPAPRLPATPSWPPPRAASGDPRTRERLTGDVSVEGGTFLVGATPAMPFVLDNEKWAHPVEVAPFAISRTPVTCGQSEPWFGGTHRVLRGGGWATRARLIRNTWRNFYTPDRRDIFAGFRTCALRD